MVTTVTVTVFESLILPILSFRNNIPRVTKITFGVFKFLFGVIVNTSRETISTYNIGC